MAVMDDGLFGEPSRRSVAAPWAELLAWIKGAAQSVSRGRPSRLTAMPEKLYQTDCAEPLSGPSCIKPILRPQIVISD